MVVIFPLTSLATEAPVPMFGRLPLNIVRGGQGTTFLQELDSSAATMSVTIAKTGLIPLAASMATMAGALARSALKALAASAATMSAAIVKLTKKVLSAS